MIPFVFIIAGVVLYFTYRTRKVPTPHSPWKRFAASKSAPLDASSLNAIEGVYTIDAGQEVFGTNAISKWTYAVEQQTTLNYLSFFCESEGTYLVCEGRRSGSDVLLNGYWRQLGGSSTGTVHLRILNASDFPYKKDTHFIIEGFYGNNSEQPSRPLRLRYSQPVPKKAPLQILAHRGGGRNIEFLPMSENTIEMMKVAARLGATGVEIDVRLTKDEVPVIIHDSFLSYHNVSGALYSGLVSNYTLHELQQQVLKKGGTVPTLQQALQTLLYETPIETVWLDIKDNCDLTRICNLQTAYLQKAAAAGRTFQVYIGIPTESALHQFRKIPAYENLPSLCELEPEIVADINANVWAPQYTGGFQSEEVEQMHGQGRKVFVWSLDNPTMISMYLKNGGFDGVVTNVPPAVFYTYYMSDISLEKNKST